ncbi:hypothetical protein SAY86_003833 [Trapa natans]|uniref:Uncharacterized protein n=1 Tax=Trapa natans TaxID=22666 RepID=A0AAN7RN65_TRANT|nr:hypothetical protein SAY86_003833 [Trapa natans]
MIVLLDRDQGLFFSSSLILLQVINVLTLSRNVTEWLQKYALEQLSEFSSHLLKFLYGSVKFTSEGNSLVDLILQIIISTLKISQKRKIYQPHFTLATDGLYHVYEIVNIYGAPRSHPTSEYGLKVMLMSTPSPIFNMEEEKLSRFITWAISVAVQSDNRQLLQSTSARSHVGFFLEEEMTEEPLMSKLLRWITASVILGCLSARSCMHNMVPTGSSMKTLEELLEYIKGIHGRGNNKASPSCQGFIIDSMLYLQQLLGINCRVLPSITSALCVLLPDITESTGSSVVSRIRCPPEANPSWRWSFYQPWKDLTLEQTQVEEMDEYHACQTLMVALSNSQQRKLPCSQFLSPPDIEKSGVFSWERSLVMEHIKGEVFQL